MDVRQKDVAAILYKMKKSLQSATEMCRAIIIGWKWLLNDKMKDNVYCLYREIFKMSPERPWNG